MLNLKKLLVIGLIFLSFVLVFANISNANGEEVIIICNDKNLYDALCEVFNPNDCIFTDTQLKIQLSKTTINTIENLNLSGKGIKSLKGLEQFKYSNNLSNLNLSNNEELSDLTPIKDIKSIEVLDISNTRVDKVDSLSELFSSSQEEGVGDLGLRKLIANNTLITSLSPLSSLSTLEEIYACNCKITDISGLAGMEKLAILKVSDNKISSISDILGSKLTTLDVSNNKISKVEFEGECEIANLFLGGNKIENADFVSGLTSINRLDLSYNRIKNIPHDLIDIIINRPTGVSINNQEIEIVAKDTSIVLEKDNLYTNLLEWANYFADDAQTAEIEEVATTIENGTLDGYKFTFDNESEVGKIVFDEGLLKGSIINITYASSTAKRPQDENTTNTTGSTNTTTDSTNTAGSTNTTNASGNTTATNTDDKTPTQTVTESGGATDSTTAEGKMPYTGITSKMIVISVLVALLITVVGSTYYHSKKRAK